MLVNDSDIPRFLNWCQGKEYLALDTETYSLAWDAKMFSLIIGDDKTQFYFDFNGESEHLGKNPLNELTTLIKIQGIFKSESRIWFMHNSKFDLRRLDIAGIKVDGFIHDTEVSERIIRNDRLSYSLENVAKEYGFEKDKAVEDYIKQNKLYEMVSIPGKQTREKNMFYSKVPLSLMYPYAKRDVEITYKIGMKQCEYFKRL